METLLTDLPPQQIFHVAESTQVAAVRRACADLAETLCFDAVQAGRLSILVTEAATNIVKHAGTGDILVRPLKSVATNGVEIIAIDRGPGIANVAASLADGVSTSGTAGNGLGAMRRLSEAFDIFSHPEKGTAVYMVLWADGKPPASPAFHFGGVCLPVPPETECGDAWACRAQDGSITLMVADGLGHGPSAAAASRPAVDVITKDSYQSSKAALEEIHHNLVGTRGAAVAVSVIRPGANTLLFSGVGNVSAQLFGRGARRHLMSHNGIVGSNMRSATEMKYDWDSNSMLVMHSDGLQTQWDIDSYPGLESCHPAVIAAVLYRDFSRRRDDSTVIVLRPI